MERMKDLNIEWAPYLQREVWNNNNKSLIPLKIDFINHMHLLKNSQEIK